VKQASARSWTRSHSRILGRGAEADACSHARLAAVRGRALADDCGHRCLACGGAFEVVAEVIAELLAADVDWRP
jgi:hypothetical protein